jgi:transcriptional regulator with XRE-family HTH domain
MKQAPNHLLQQARRERNWTQQYLADQLKVGLQTVSSWEQGTRLPSLESRRRLCELFGKTPEQLGLPHPKPHTRHAPDAQNSRSLPPEEQTRQRMIDRVFARWINGVLKHSLHQEVLIELGLLEEPEAVANPWHLEFFEQEDLPSQPLAPGTRLIEVYDAANGSLLILGEPGAGKTTLLLDLAQELLKRAENDSSHPIPVIFPLASWATKQQPLSSWLVEELQTKYQVPSTLGQTWINNRQILPLLDGLDEVASPARRECIKAINAFLSDFVPLVVCSRRSEYFTQATERKLELQNAVMIQPLTPEQTRVYCQQVGLDPAPFALDPVLLASPLVLSILTLASTPQEPQGTTIPTCRQNPPQQDSQTRLLALYVQRMLERRRRIKASYSRQQTLSWLTWLARQMQRNQTTEFAVERMQPEGLPQDRLRRSYQRMVIRLVYGIESGVFAGVFSWVRGGKVGSVSGVGEGLLGLLGAKPGNAALGWMAPGLGGGVEGGGSLVLILVLLLALITLIIGASGQPTLSLSAARAGLVSGLRTGSLCGASIGLLGVLVFAASGGIGHGLAYGVGAGLMCGLLAGLLSGLITGLRPTSPSQHIPSEEKRSVLARLGESILMGIGPFVSFALVGAFLHLDVAPTVADGVIVGLFSSITFGLGGITNLFPALGRRITPAETVVWSWSQVRQDLLRNMLQGAIVGGAVMIPVGLVIGAISGVFYGASYGLRFGFLYGLMIGIITAIAGILTRMLKSGWNCQMLAEHQQFQPNAGIARSARHALFAAGLFGPLGGIASGLACALAFGVVGGLDDWLILSLGLTLVCSILFALTFALLQGGVAVLEHYLLRWYLWRAGCVAFNYVAFLDYSAERILLRKMGGEYMFVHQLLMDYFASLPNE